MRLHLNADVGEGFDSDAELMRFVTQANVACGFHAGDAGTMRTVCASAVANQVEVGAQPSYRDRANFGRAEVEIGRDQLIRDLTEQVAALRVVAGSVGATVSYLKPHGALYNRVVWDERQARALVDATLLHGLALMTLPGCVAHELMTAAGGTVIREFFADRAYDGNGHLVSRGLDGALVTDPREVTRRVRRLLVTGGVRTADGGTVDLDVDTVCVHGDTAGAVVLARAVAEVLSAEPAAAGPDG